MSLISFIERLFHITPKNVQQTGAGSTVGPSVSSLSSSPSSQGGATASQTNIVQGVGVGVPIGSGGFGPLSSTPPPNGGGPVTNSVMQTGTGYGGITPPGYLSSSPTPIAAPIGPSVQGVGVGVPIGPGGFGLLSSTAPSPGGGPVTNSIMQTGNTTNSVRVFPSGTDEVQSTYWNFV